MSIVNSFCSGFSFRLFIFSTNYVVLMMLHSYFKFMWSLNLLCMYLAILCVGAWMLLITGLTRADGLRALIFAFRLGTYGFIWIIYFLFVGSIMLLHCVTVFWVVLCIFWVGSIFSSIDNHHHRQTIKRHTHIEYVRTQRHIQDDLPQLS
jgi:hypothetical protein